MRSRQNLLLLIIGVILGFGMLLSRQGLTDPGENLASRLITPLQRGTHQLSVPIAAFLNRLTGSSDLEQVVQRQEAEIRQLSAEIARLWEMEEENRRLRALLSFSEVNPQFEYLGANIIGRDPSNLVRAVVIDKGIENGIEEGMTVVASGGLVGRIVKVYQNSAWVLLIVDPSSSVSALVQRTRALGVARGGIDPQLTLEYLTQEEAVQERDIILTSRLGGNYPEGIIIGQVREITRNPVELFQQISLEPAVPFGELETLMVITNFMPQSLEQP